MERLYLHQRTEKGADKFSHFTFSFGFLDHRNLCISLLVGFYRGNIKIIQGQEKYHTRTD